MLALFMLNLVSCNISFHPSTEIPATQTKVPEKASTLNPAQITMQTSEAFILRDSGFLSGEPCMAPCFLGITPGKTSFENAIPLLEKYLYYPAWECEYGFNFKMIGCSLSGEHHTIRITPDFSTNLVREISYFPSDSISLEKIIEHYGEPDHMYIWDSQVGEPDTAINLYFDSIQTRVTLKELYRYEYEVAQSSEVVEIFFSDETLYLDYVSTVTHSWKGYGIYP